MASIKLVSLNIEHSKHVDIIVPFLKAQNADVICLQEVVERDLPRFVAELGMHVHFGPQCLFAEKTGDDPLMTGEAILSRLEFKAKDLRYYGGTQPGVQVFDRSDKPGSNARIPKVIVIAEIEKEGGIFRVATTHAAQSPGSEPTEVQRRELPLMMNELAVFPELILTGDFNSPRGYEIFDTIAKRYTDNVPKEYATTTDVHMHRMGKERPDDFKDKLVDGLFTTPEYSVSAFELVSGVSDHMALVATVSTT